MPIEAVIFDMDGLMIDSERVYWTAGRELAGRYGKSVQDATLGRMMGRSPIDSITVYASETGIDIDPATLLEQRDARVLQILQESAAPMPGLFEALDRLQGGYKLAIATSAKRYLVDVIDRSVNFVRYFQAVQTSEGILHGKPHPEIYFKAMAKIEVRPTACVVLEDSSNGARAGKSAGAYTIAVPSEHTRDQDFSFADHVADNLLAAVDRIEQL